MKPLVLYHAGCWDGFCAAWIARKALGDIEAIPVQYGQPAPIDQSGRDVYILDFSYPRAEMEGIIRQSKFVCCLDHHKTAQEELAGLEGGVIHFDMEKSGGRLAHEWFFPQAKDSNWLVDYTEDRDLWRWKLPFSREINAWLRSWPLDFEMWDRFACDYPLNKAEAGAAILRREQQIVESHVGFAYEIEMAGHKILAVNATVLSSEIAGELAKGRPFGACYFDQAEDRIWSLRSEANGVDVCEVAKQFGGGGHKNASGFKEKRS